MKLIFLGTGSAFTVGDGNYHSNMMLENSKHQHLLIDCGSDIRFSLHDLGFSYLDIQSIYISHMHADHMGGMEWLAFTTKFDPRYTNKPHLYASADLIDDLWQALKFGLTSLKEEKIDLSTYFEVYPIQNKQFHWENQLFHLFPTLHVKLAHGQMPSYGLFFETDHKKVLITTDTQFTTETMLPLYEKADIIFHDCETLPFKSGVHAHYTELKTLPLFIRKKMWLYHYQPGSLPDAEADGFQGFVKRGQCFDFSQ